MLSRLFDSPVREGVLTLGLSSTEVAAVGLVALAGGDAALALGALAGSLIASATLGPLLIGLLAADAASTDTGALLGRFALVVLIPLAAGVAARSIAPRMARGEPWYAAGSTVAVAALVYAALSDTSAGEHLAPALAAGAAFLALAAIPAIASARIGHATAAFRRRPRGQPARLRRRRHTRHAGLRPTGRHRRRDLRRPHAHHRGPHHQQAPPVALREHRHEANPPTTRLNRMAASRATRPATRPRDRIPCDSAPRRCARPSSGVLLLPPGTGNARELVPPLLVARSDHAPGLPRVPFTRGHRRSQGCTPMYGVCAAAILGGMTRFDIRIARERQRSA